MERVFFSFTHFLPFSTTLSDSIHFYCQSMANSVNVAFDYNSQFYDPLKYDLSFILTHTLAFKDSDFEIDRKIDIQTQINTFRLISVSPWNFATISMAGTDRRRPSPRPKLTIARIGWKLIPTQVSQIKSLRMW